MVDRGTPNEEKISLRSFFFRLVAPLVVSAFLVFAFSGTRPLMDTSEARYAEVAREMAVEGQWLVPHLAGHPHLTKPPLTYWLVAVSMRALGHGEWAARFPIGLAALLTTLVTALCAHSMFGARVGTCAAWLQGLSVVPLVSANVITTDGFLALFETAYMGCAWMLISQSDPSRRKFWQHGFWVLLAGAFMTKGPAGLVPLAALIPIWVRAKNAAVWRSLLSGRSALLFLLLIVPWPVAVALLEPEALKVWYNEALVNVLEEANHDFPRWAYPLLLVLGSFPACIGLVPTITHWKAERDERTKFARSFLMAWIIIPMLLLSAQKTRLPLYILPLYPPLSMLAAWGMTRGLGDEIFSARNRRMAAAAIFLFATVFLGAKWAYSVTVQTRDARRCFKDIAQIIRSSLSSPEDKPRLYIKEGRLGYGLMYYLNTSNLVRLGSRDSQGNPSPTLHQVLVQASSSGRDEFLILEADDVDHETTVAKYAVAVGGNSAYKVWKLTRNGPP